VIIYWTLLLTVKKLLQLYFLVGKNAWFQCKVVMCVALTEIKPLPFAATILSLLRKVSAKVLQYWKWHNIHSEARGCFANLKNAWTKQLTSQEHMYALWWITQLKM